MALVNEIMSWCVSRNSSADRSACTVARRMAAISASGITPNSVHASQTATSTCSQSSMRCSSDQTRPISGRVYRGITRRNRQCRA